MAVLLDLYSRRVVGWAMGQRLTVELAEQAFTMALANRRPRAGRLHHSDRGSQGGFNRSSQHLIVEQILDTRPVLRPASSNQAFSGVWN